MPATGAGANETENMNANEMNAKLRADLEPQREKLAEDFDRYVRSLFATMTNRYGPGLRCRDAWNPDQAVIRNVLHGVTSFESGGPSAPLGAPLVLDDAKLARAAASYANETIEAIVARVTQKAGELDEVAGIYLEDRAHFQVSGRKSGHAVTIKQTMILNVSKLGKLFNQFPARITVDGRPMSEAKFRKLAA